MCRADILAGGEVERRDRAFEMLPNLSNLLLNLLLCQVLWMHIDNDHRLAGLVRPDNQSPPVAGESVVLTIVQLALFAEILLERVCQLDVSRLGDANLVGLNTDDLFVSR